MDGNCVALGEELANLACKPKWRCPAKGRNNQEVGRIFGSTANSQFSATEQDCPRKQVGESDQLSDGDEGIARLDIAIFIANSR